MIGKCSKTISLIICTRNRCRQLSVFLGHIEQLCCQYDWELVVVNNGSSDNTGILVQKFAKDAKLDVTLVDEPQPGLARARNAGIARAKGEILAFTDDDCYPQADFLEQIIRVFEDPEIGYLGGRILLFDPADAPITIRADINERLVPPRSFVPSGLIQGANMAVRRSVVDAISGFDPMLGPGTSFNFEDVDFVARASAAGWKGGYYPGPVVYHHHGRKRGREVSALNRSYDYGRGAYYAKFILNRQTRMLYVKSLWWQMNRYRRKLLMEIRGAGNYCYVRLLLRFGLSRPTPSSLSTDECSQAIASVRQGK